MSVSIIRRSIMNPIDISTGSDGGSSSNSSTNCSSSSNFSTSTTFIFIFFCLPTLVRDQRLILTLVQILILVLMLIIIIMNIIILQILQILLLLLTHLDTHSWLPFNQSCNRAVSTCPVEIARFLSPPQPRL